MATQFITLEEAARRLGIPAEEFKRRLKTEWTHIVPMRDGPNLRFRENQIEELSRQLGAASDPELPLASLDQSDPGSDDFKLAPGPKTGKHPKSGVKRAEEPLAFDGSDDDIFSLSAEPAPSKKPTDESTDSDVRLEASSPPKSSGPNIPTEEISLDLGGPSSAVIKGGSSAKLSAPKSSGKINAGDSGKKLSSDSGRHPAGKNKNNLGDSSEFELSLDADSDDFELQMSGDSSEEVDLGSSPIDEGGRAGKSGVNLRNPGDSGIPLDKGRAAGSSGRNLGAKPPIDDSDDFELSLEADSGEAEPVKSPPPKSSGKGSSRTPKAPLTTDSDSEFELTLDDSGDAGSLGSLESAAIDEEGKGDIFETDFEIPNLPDESGSEAVALESDTDLEAGSEDVALDDVELTTDDESSGSEAVVLDEDDEAPPSGRSGRRSRRAAAADGDEDPWASAGGGRRKTDDDEDEVPAGAAAPPAPWGVIPALVLFPSFALLIVGGLMSYELLHTMTGYAQPRKPAAPIVRQVAKTLEMDVRDQ